MDAVEAAGLAESGAGLNAPDAGGTKAAGALGTALWGSAEAGFAERAAGADAVDLADSVFSATRTMESRSPLGPNKSLTSAGASIVT
jgi:hypothetical protein